jgi:hypothetical protein
MSSSSTSSNTIEAPVPGMPPVHPGAVLAEILEDHGLNVVAAAARLGGHGRRSLGWWPGSRARRWRSGSERCAATAPRSG